MIYYSQRKEENEKNKERSFRHEIHDNKRNI